MTEDLEPPSFQFDRGRGEREREEDRPSPEDQGMEEEPIEREIVVRRVDDERDEGRGRGFRRFIPEMSETTARIVVAIPWIIFAIAIVAAGGLVFTLALVVLAILGLREFFRMAEP